MKVFSRGFFSFSFFGHSLVLIGIAVLFFFSSFITSGVSSSADDRWVAPRSADSLKNPFPDEPLVVQQGEELYQVLCWSCHGEEGFGDGAAGGALGVKPANFHEDQVKNQSDGALFWKLSTGRGNMPPFQDVLSEEQRWQLIVYIRKLNQSK
jgi:mono/diheme cytochrome c family protein